MREKKTLGYKKHFLWRPSFTKIAWLCKICTEKYNILKQQKKVRLHPGMWHIGVQNFFPPSPTFKKMKIYILNPDIFILHDFMYWDKSSTKPYNVRLKMSIEWKKRNVMRSFLRFYLNVFLDLWIDIFAKDKVNVQCGWIHKRFFLKNYFLIFQIN